MGIIGSNMCGCALSVYAFTSINALSTACRTGSTTDGSIFSVTVLWQKLRMHNYDMLYLLFEETLKYLIEVGRMLRKESNRTEVLLRAIENL